MAEVQNSPAPTPGFAEELTQYWRRLPNKGLFFTLLAAWSLLFHLFGNATFGYFHTSSLFGWMYNYYNHTGTDGGAGDDSYGNLVPIVVLALFWWKRDRLLALATRVWWPGLVLLAFAVVLHLAGFLVQQTRISVVAYFIGVYAMIGMAWGPRWMIASFFPFFLFAFSVPVSTVAEPVTFPLRMFVSKVVGSISNFMGLDVIREGTSFFNSQHTFAYEVAAACSGIRSFVAIVALCTVYGFVSFETNWKRALMILSAIPLAVLGNVVRMMCIILAASWFGKDQGDFVHENAILSMLPYVPAIAGVLLLGNWLYEETPADGPATMEHKAA